MGLQVKSGPLDLESGKAATVSLGRPSLYPRIGGMVAEHSTDERIALIASGKPSTDAILRHSSSVNKDIVKMVICAIFQSKWSGMLYRTDCTADYEDRTAFER